MIIELTKNNIDEIKNSFISLDQINREFSNNPYAKYLLLKENNKLIGYIYYSDIYDRVEINQFEINSIHRNCGKGNYLLNELIKIVEKDITLEVKETNKNAIHLYEKNGFKKVAIRKGYYNGIDGILMERKYMKKENEMIK